MDLVDQFEANRAHLQQVAYRMLGSVAEADDAVQEAWLRLNRTDVSGVENLPGWLTTVTARICLNMLRSRNRLEALDDGYVPDPIVTLEPADEAVMADSVGLALLVVLEVLPPAERLAFVLHDLFAMPFDEIAKVVDKTPEAARQLASRARRRVRGAAIPDPDLQAQRRVVDAFYAAARGGDMEQLIATLHPEAVLRADAGEERHVIRGAEKIAANARMFATPDRIERPVLVNGQAGAIIEIAGQPTAIMAFTIVEGVIAEIEILADPARLATALQIAS
jgi:RNA polymerase sigma-70 factor (ECF subfamily)